MGIIYKLENKTALYFICNRINGQNRKVEQPMRSRTGNKANKQVDCFARANQVWLTVNHNNSVTSGK